MRPRTARDRVSRVSIVRAALARFDSESPGVVFVADEIAGADGDVVVVGRVQEWRDGHRSQELALVLLWEFEDRELIRISRFTSKREALDAARFSRPGLE